MLHGQKIKSAIRHFISMEACNLFAKHKANSKSEAVDVKH